MKPLIRRIMSHPELVARPPVMVDVGASAALPRHWRQLAPYAICVAFDADTRDFEVKEETNRGWRKLVCMNRLITSTAAESQRFHLTAFPYCSSTLAPNHEALADWAFSWCFEVESTTDLPSLSLAEALARLEIDHIDWFKTDTQGTDLRIFAALPTEIAARVIAAEFEPGVIDAYHGEDKLHQLMAYMERHPFWISDMRIKGSQRLKHDEVQALNAFQRRSIGSFLKEAPGWCEITYLNRMTNRDLDAREFLLGWLFASMRGEHGFALQLAQRGQAQFSQPIFSDLEKKSRRNLASLSGYCRFVVRGFRRVAELLRERFIDVRY